MTGKVFSETKNIYQDQAKVLFDYYRAAAEKIVAEENSVKNRINNVQKEIDQQDALYKGTMTNFVLGIILIVVGIALAFLYSELLGALSIVGIVLLVTVFVKRSNINKEKSKLNDEIKALNDKFKKIFRDYKVNKLGVAYIPVASRVAFNGKSFLVDHTGNVPTEEFKLQLLRDNNGVTESIRELQELTQEIPMVEGSENAEEVNVDKYSRSIQKVTYHDYLGGIDRALRRMSFNLGNCDISDVSLPVIRPNTDFDIWLKEYSTETVGKSPIFNVFDTTLYDGQIDHFNHLNEIRMAVSSQSASMDEILRQLMQNMSKAVQLSTNMKSASTNRLVEYSNTLLYNIMKSSFNFYSPQLEAEEIARIKEEEFKFDENSVNYKPFKLRESSRVKFDLHSMMWVAEDGSRTSTPFGLTQIQEEVITPVVINLLKETKNRRQDHYNEIDKEKMTYFNEWNKEVNDFMKRNKTEADRLSTEILDALQEFQASCGLLESLKKTDNALAENMSLDNARVEVKDELEEKIAMYKMKADQMKSVSDNFSQYVERMNDDIQERGEAFRKVKNYDASLTDQMSHDIAVATSEGVSALPEDEQKRRQQLVSVSPLLAQTSDLPPAPSCEDVTDEHFRINLLNETRDALNELDIQKNNSINQ